MVSFLLSSPRRRSTLPITQCSTSRSYNKTGIWLYHTPKRWCFNCGDPSHSKGTARSRKQREARGWSHGISAPVGENNATPRNTTAQVEGPICLKRRCLQQLFSVLKLPKISCNEEQLHWLRQLIAKMPKCLLWTTLSWATLTRCSTTWILVIHSPSNNPADEFLLCIKLELPKWLRTWSNRGLFVILQVSGLTPLCWSLRKLEATDFVSTITSHSTTANSSQRPLSTHWELMFCSYPRPTKETSML